MRPAPASAGDRLSIPVKHMSGRYFAPAASCSPSSRPAGRSSFATRPGRTRTARSRDVAGVANERGNVVGLMPHPEHAVDPLTGSADGLALFESPRSEARRPRRREPAAAPARRRTPPAPFVVGVGRSGTTLLRLMLDAHPELAIPPETHFVPELIERGARRPTPRARRRDRRRRRWGDFGLDADELREPGRRARAARRRRRCCAPSTASTPSAQGKPRWGDKTPDLRRPHARDRRRPCPRRASST